MQDLIKTATAFLLNEDAPKQVVEAEENNSDLFVWTKKGKHNYANFLKANANRVGKPMLDGGIKANAKEEYTKRNGKPVEGMIYCGEGCVIYKNKRDGDLVFAKIPEGLVNTDDGSGQGWSGYKHYNDSGSNTDARVTTENALQFKEFAKAMVVAAKNISKADLVEDAAPALTEAKMNNTQNVVKKITDIFDFLDELVMMKNSRLEKAMGPETKQYATELKELKGHLIAAEKIFLFDIAQPLDLATIFDIPD
jgi:hypothetical protein